MPSLIHQAVILAGGRGTRLAPLTDHCPKPLLPVNGVPFIDLLLKQLKAQGIQEVVLLTGYLKEKIRNHVGDGEAYGLSVRYSEGEVDFETGKRIKNAESLLQDHFLLLYADNYWEGFNLAELEKFFKKTKKEASVVVFDNHLKTTVNNIKVGEDGGVKIYDKSRTRKDLNGVEIGFFILKKKWIQTANNKNFSFEKGIIPKLIQKKQLAGFLTPIRYYSVGNHDTYYDLCRYQRSKKTIFLDRDGVINRKALNRGEYIRKLKDFSFLSGAVEGIKLLKENGYKVIVITNQAGVGRKIFSLKTLKKIHEYMQKKLKKAGTTVDKIYCCPHDWVKTCGCRKPGGSMLYQAAIDFDLSLRHTILIGDDRRDMMLGDNIGAKTLFFKEGDRLDAFVRKNILNQKQ